VLQKTNFICIDFSNSERHRASLTSLAH